MIKKLLLTLTVLLSIDSLIAQEGFDRCGTMEMEAQLRAKYPSLGTLEDFEKWLAPKIKVYKEQQEKDGSPEQVYNIPVVIHIIHNSGEAIGVERNISNAQAISQINVLNEDFRKLNANFSTTPSVFQSVAADCELNFCLASVDPLGNAMTEEGIDRIDVTSISGGYNTASTSSADGYPKSFVQSTIKPNTQWDPDKYLNMWVLHLGQSSGGNQLLGYAQFPNSSGLQGSLPDAAANTDGLVMWYKAFGNTGNVHPSYNGGKTATHEMGHWLGLRHIWGDDGGACGNQGDYCNDTPDQAGSNGGCPTHPSSSCSNSGDMFMNFMDYSNDACLTMFTQDQKARMMTVMQNSPRRGILNSSNVCAQTICDFETHMGDFDTPSNYPDDAGNPPWGWISGHNSFQDLAKCEKFFFGGPQQRYLKGVELYFAKAVDMSGFGTVDVIVWASDQSFGGGIPQNIITYETVPISSLNTGGLETYVTFTNPPTVNAGEYFFVGIGLNYGTPQDSVSLYTNADGEGTSTNYSYELWSDMTWASMQSSLSWNKQINFAISPELCYQAVGMPELEEAEEQVNVYPNPSTGIINVEFEEAEQIEVYNLLGEIVYLKEPKNNQYSTVIDLSDQRNGIYVVRIKSEDSFITKKILLTK